MKTFVLGEAVRTGGGGLGLTILRFYDFCLLGNGNLEKSK